MTWVPPFWLLDRRTGMVALALVALVGLVLVIINVRRLIADWPRLKPVHNIDVTWVQIYLGVALMVVAWCIATNPARELSESTMIYRAPDR